MQERPAIDHELLLAQAGWVRGLAGTLVRDPLGADDVAQETLLAALLSPPLRMEDERTLRAWLARVVTNLARLAARRNVRRERREEAAARPEEVAPAHEAVERAGMLQRVLDAVLELDEPYRSTVLLRFFDGLDAAQIGLRTGASPVAVRKRLSRGLERLRKRLDHEQGGDREAWRAVFLPWALARTDAGVPAASASLGAGSVSGLQAALAAAAVLALAGTSALVAASLQGGGGTRAASPVERAEVALARGPSVRRAVAPPAPTELSPAAPRSVAWIIEVPLEDTRAPASPPPVPEPDASALRGRVVDLAGFGVAGAGLRASPAGGSVLATSARDGSFEIAFPEQLGAGARLLAEAPGLATLRAAEVDSGSGEELLIVALPAVDLDGLVVDAAGEPVAGARIALDVPDAAFADLWLALDGTVPVAREATSDEAGRFELAALPTHAELGLVVSAEGQGELRVPVPAHSASGLTLRFPGDGAGTWLEGLVLLPGGSPAAGARVRAGSSWALADARGRYRVPVDPARPPPWIVAELAGWLPASKALGEVAGPPQGGGGHATGSGAGKFGAGSGGPGAPGSNGGSGGNGGAGAGGGAQALVVLQIQGELLSIAGRAVQPGGVPAAGWQVFALDDGVDPRHPQRPAGGVAAQVTSDADGSFLLEGLLDRAYHVLAIDPASGERAGPESVPAGSTAALVAQSTARGPGRGRVLAGDGRGLAGVSVVPVLASDGGFLAAGPAALTNGTGAFELPGGAGWKGLVKVQKPGGRSATFAGAGQMAQIQVPEDAWFQFLAMGMEPEPDALSVLDPAGDQLAIHAPSGAVERLRLARGRGPVVRVAETGKTLVLYRTGTEVARLPLHLVAGQIMVVRGSGPGAPATEVSEERSGIREGGAPQSKGGPSLSEGGSGGGGKSGGQVTGPAPRQP